MPNDNKHHRWKLPTTQITTKSTLGLWLQQQLNKNGLCASTISAQKKNSTNQPNNSRLLFGQKHRKWIPASNNNDATNHQQTDHHQGEITLDNHATTPLRRQKFKNSTANAEYMRFAKCSTPIRHSAQSPKTESTNTTSKSSETGNTNWVICLKKRPNYHHLLTRIRCLLHLQ